MKQVKWEDDVKDALEKRVIKPSETSWNTLSERLDASEKQQTKPMYWWIGIAASVTAVLFITTMFFSGNTPEVQNPILVDTQEHLDEQTLEVDQPQQKQQLVEQRKVLAPAEPIEEEENTKHPIKSQGLIPSPTQQNTQIAKNNPVLPKSALKTSENQKVTEIVAQIQDIKRKGQPITDADIEALLTNAQREIHYKSAMREANYTVNANTLLREVEMDLQESFRNKIFEALKNSYETIRTAVVERQH
ncbi:hypothetical protein BXY82_1321 [Gelidibacter sediminis]|uniref:Uncharacterized protein n=1 Tax=Gelidibacter sediminis TaxID=1608710 RepID=A0A4R7QAU5_9FLAO|nr:hypothetical protein [Gelidibacter sediminis]TDU43900.1 hypothetical protein BXY82_1321 [Gelidibacter sediminis]